MSEADLISEILHHDDVFLKSQQLNEPDLSYEEKVAFLREFLAQKKHSLFLARFGRYMSPAHLKYFEDQPCPDPEERFCIEHHINGIKSRHQNNSVVIKNRRFQALKQLLRGEDDHFSESEMMNREPVLYEQMVGRYMTDAEKQMRDREDNPSFVNVLMKGIELEQIRTKRHDLERDSGSQMVEDEKRVSSSSDDDDDDDPEVATGGTHWGEYESKEPRKVNMKDSKGTDDNDRNAMKQEFLDIMYNKFISGNDRDFDYKTVDENADFDDMEAQAQDDEDKYFDSSDSEIELADDVKENFVDK